MPNPWPPQEPQNPGGFPQLRGGGNDGRLWFKIWVGGVGIIGQVQPHDFRPAHCGRENKEGNQQEAEVYHRGEVYACRELFAFFYAGTFFVAGG